MLLAKILRTNEIVEILGFMGTDFGNQFRCVYKNKNYQILSIANIDIIDLSPQEECEERMRRVQEEIGVTNTLRTGSVERGGITGTTGVGNQDASGSGGSVQSPQGQDGGDSNIPPAGDGTIRK